MSNLPQKQLSQSQKIINFLKANPTQEFTAREIAINIVAQYPDDYVEKKKGFANEKLFLQQIVAEIGSQKNAIIKGGNIFLAINLALEYFGMQVQMKK